jgi:hypothetical protein
MRCFMEVAQPGQVAGPWLAFGVPLVGSAVWAGEIAPGEPR